METQAIETGIHRNVPASVYHSWPYASNSFLSDIAARSAYHATYRRLHPEQTEAMRIGEAAHLCILENDLYAERYAVLSGSCCGKTKKGEPCQKGASIFRANGQFCGLHDDPEAGELDSRSVLSDADDAMCKGMAASVLMHPKARALLKRVSDIELSAVWDDSESGVRCKARLDGFAEGIAIVDLKTTENASREAFEKSIFNFGYFRQAAMYLNGAKAVGLDVDAFCFIAVEKKPPHGVAVYQLEADAIEYGRSEVKRLLGVVAACEASDNWPGYSEGIEYIGVPEWAGRKLEREMAI